MLKTHDDVIYVGYPLIFLARIFAIAPIKTEKRRGGSTVVKVSNVFFVYSIAYATLAIYFLFTTDDGERYTNDTFTMLVYKCYCFFDKMGPTVHTISILIHRIELVRMIENYKEIDQQLNELNYRFAYSKQKRNVFIYFIIMLGVLALDTYFRISYRNLSLSTGHVYFVFQLWGFIFKGVLSHLFWFFIWQFTIRFTAVNACLKDINDPKSGDLKIRSLIYIHNLIVQSSDLFNAVYGTSVTYVIILSILFLTMSIAEVYLIAVSQIGGGLLRFFLTVITPMTVITKVVVLSVLSNNMVLKAKKSGDIYHMILSQIKIKEEEDVAMRFEAQKPKITMYGLWNIDNCLIFSITGIIFGQTIIFIQFASVLND